VGNNWLVPDLKTVKIIYNDPKIYPAETAIGEITIPQGSELFRFNNFLAWRLP
jgi:hypothetical protein